MPKGEESCTSREHKSSEEQVWSWSTTSDTISDALSTEAKKEKNGVGIVADHRRRSSAALTVADLTLSAESSRGVSLTQTGFCRLLLDAGGNL